MIPLRRQPSHKLCKKNSWNFYLKLGPICSEVFTSNNSSKAVHSYKINKANEYVDSFNIKISLSVMIAYLKYD